VLKTEFTKMGVFTTLPNLKIMLPEFANVDEALAAPTLADSSTAAVVGLIGVQGFWGADALSNFSDRKPC
jgi:hypothetical protein